MNNSNNYQNHSPSVVWLLRASYTENDIYDDDGDYND